jgi:ribosomal protein S18 acetylase RimI-like enzyme
MSLSAITYRPVTAADGEAIERLHRNLTDRDGYLRFFEVPPNNLRRLVNLLTMSDEKHVAIGAFTGPICLGVAHYVADDDGHGAEVAIAVASESHAHGIGTQLLERLAAKAVARGIRTLRADVLATNNAVFEMISDARWPVQQTFDGPEVHITADLPASTSPRLSRTATALSQAANLPSTVAAS